MIDVTQAKERKVQLTLTEEQARVAMRACEVYSRIVMGQFQEITSELLDMSVSTDDYCQRREAANELLFKAREQIYPELHGIGHSYGVGKFEHADRAFDIYQVIRALYGDPRGTFSYYDLPDAKFVYGEE